MEKIKNRAANLLSVKTFVTMVLTVVFSILSLRGDITGQEFLTVFSVVIAFYFGTQFQQNKTANTTADKAAEE